MAMLAQNLERVSSYYFHIMISRIRLMFCEKSVSVLPNACYNF